jgi:hypothetical protein
MNIKPRNVHGLRLAAGALLIVTAAAGAAQVALADTANPTPVHQGHDASSATGPGADITQNPYTAALEALVTRGVINQAQADTVQQQVLAGSVYPEALVADGTLSNDQMRQVGDSLGAVKRAAAGDTGTAPDQFPTPVNKPSAPAGGKP